LKIELKQSQSCTPLYCLVHLLLPGPTDGVERGSWPDACLVSVRL